MTTRVESGSGATGAVGARALRVEGREHVTGRTRYVDDIYFPGMLWVRVKMSPHHNAKILRIDTSKAERVAGVAAVVTGKDVPYNRFGLAVDDQPVLADDYVRHLGQAVAAVAAVDEDTAQEAVDLIEVEYEVLPAVFDVHEALRPGAPVIHESGRNYLMYASRDHREIRLGDCEKGFREADLIVESHLSTQMREHCPIEPHVSVAQADYNGKVTVYTCSQAPHFHQGHVAKVLKLPLNKVRLSGGTVGGGFGSKNELLCDHLTALLALRTGKPVKWLWTREQEFLNSSVDNPYPYIYYKTGVKRDGTMVARYVKAIQDTGAYLIFGKGGVDKFGIYGRGPYNIPNYWYDGYCVFTNKAFSGALRGYNVANCNFACEAHTDRIAVELSMDPLELRRKNFVKDGDLATTQYPLHGMAAREVTEEAVKAFGGWEPRVPGPHPDDERPRGYYWGGTKRVKRGRGICVGIQATGSTGGNDPSMAEVQINYDGSVWLRVGSVDHGGGDKTVMAQIAAEELGLPLEDISITVGDTETTPLSTGTFGNREVYITGNAVRRAAAEARRTLLEFAAGELGTDPNKLEIRERKVVRRDAPEQALPVADLAAKATWLHGRFLHGRGEYLPNVVWIDDATGKGKPTEQYIFATSVCEVEVDEETGEVRVTKLALCHDVGRAINPLFCEGQLDGGIAFGVGFALMEDMLPYYPKPDHIATGFHEYKFPSTRDMPETINRILEIPSPTGPFGAKGLGEFTANTQAAAITNAIYDATGVWINDLPATADKVLAAIKAKKGK